MKTEYKPEVQAWLQKFHRSERILTWYAKILGEIGGLSTEQFFSYEVLDRYLNKIRYKPKIEITEQTFKMVWRWSLRYMGAGDHGVDWEFFEYTWSYIRTAKYDKTLNPWGDAPDHLPNTHNRKPTDY